MPRLSLAPLISAAAIQQRVAELGRQITSDSRERAVARAHSGLAEVPAVTLIGVLNGCLCLLADLVRQVEIPQQVETVRASSYRGSATSPGQLQLDLSSLPPLAGRDLILVDDILDTGQTLSRLVERLEKQQPRSIELAVLLWKRARTRVPLVPRYVGFEIEDHFVVGYGLDYRGDYRHLPDVWCLDPEAHA